MAATPANPRAHNSAGYANVAANLANTNRKVVDPKPPNYEKYIPHLHGPGRAKSVSSTQGRPQSSPVSLASSKAALLAHQGQAAAASSSSINKSNVALENRAAAAAARGSNLPHTARPRRPASSDGPNSIQSNHGLGDRAAAAATKSWTTTSNEPARAISVYGARSEHASPAVSRAWKEQKLAAQRPVVAPLSDREAAMIQRRIEARQQESTDRHERQPIIRIKPEYLGEHPPVKLERDEKAHAADLHQQAVNLAKQAYARQQQQQSQKSSVTSPKQNPYEKARRSDRADLEELDRMRNYYGTPAPVQRSKSQRLLKRSKSQQSRPREAEDQAQSQRIRAQMNQMRSQIDHIDAGKQEQDRKRLLEAAKKKVQSDMLKMDESIYKGTGKMSKAMMDDWDTKSRERTRGQNQQAMFQGLQPDRAVNIGGDRLIDQSEIDQLAVSRVKPTLAGIDEAVQKRRDLDEQKREEKEEKQREKEKEKEEKAEAKREKAEERRKLKEQRAAEKAEAGEGDAKHASLTERLPALPHFGRHKRTESAEIPDSSQNAYHDGEREAHVEHESPTTTDKKRSSMRLPVFTKFSRHRRNESVGTVSDDELSDDDDDVAGSHESPASEKRSPRKIPILEKLGRSHHNATVEQPREAAVAHEAQAQQPESPTRPSKSIKSRLSKLVHRHQHTTTEQDGLGSGAKGKSFEHTNGSITTMTFHDAAADPAEIASVPEDEELLDDDDESVYEDDDNDDDELYQKSSRPKISAPILAGGSSPLERKVSVDDRDDKLFGKHLPSKFHENM